MRVTADDVKAPRPRLRGQGHARGALLVARGTRITPQVQALLTAAGVLTVPVFRRPRVGVVLSSDDVVSPADVEHPWQRPDSMSAYVRALLARWGYATQPVELLAPLRPVDSPEARATYLNRVFDLMSRYDLLIGVGVPADSGLLSRSVGGSFSCFAQGKDHVHFDNTTERGFACGLGDDRTPPVIVKNRIYDPGSLSRVAATEGRAYYDRSLVINVPGHTPEVATIMHLFVRRILDAMEGVERPGPVWRTATLKSPITRHPLEHRFPWGTASVDGSGRVVIEVNDDQNSLSFNTFATSNALLAIRSGAGRVDTGDCVDYLSLE